DGSPWPRSALCAGLREDSPETRVAASDFAAARIGRNRGMVSQQFEMAGDDPSRSQCCSSLAANSFLTPDTLSVTKIGYSRNLKLAADWAIPQMTRFAKGPLLS